MSFDPNTLADPAGADGAKALVKQAAQVLEVLEYFAAVRQPATLAEISTTMGWPKSSTSNLLATLRTLGYLYEPGSRRGYYPTTKLSQLAEKIRSGEPVPETVDAVLSSLVAQTGESAALAAPNGLTNVVLAISESPSAVRFTTKVGDCYPMSNSASGRALMSLLPAAERARMVAKSPIDRYTEKTLTTIEEIEADIQASEKRGWFLGDQELQIGLMGVAVPFKLQQQHYAILIAGPTERFQPRLEAIAAALVQAVGSNFGSA